MLSQQQNDIHVSEEETPPPHAQKQPSAPTFSWRSWSPWLRILGVVVPLVTGFALAVSPPLYTLGMLIPPLIAIASGVLLRTWWAMLIVPVAFSVAFFLGYALSVGGFDHMHIGTSGFADGLDFVAILVVLPMAICVAIGTPLGKLIEKEQRH
jgi:hypothetical protein